MSKLYLFAEDPNTGHAQQVPVDPDHLDDQIAVLRAAGKTTVVMNADERLDMALLTRDLAESARAADDESLLCQPVSTQDTDDTDGTSIQDTYDDTDGM